MLGAITGFLTALPEILKLIQGIWGWINQVSGNNPAGWISKAHDVFAQAQAADTPEKKQDAAQKIAQLFSSG